MAILRFWKLRIALRISSLSFWHIFSAIFGVAQDLPKKELGRRFVNKVSWPPNSPDLSLLDYYFWNTVKQKVYAGKRTPFKDLDELKKKIQAVWRSCCDMEVMRKAIQQFRPWLKAVIEQEGEAIKQIYG